MGREGFLYIQGVREGTGWEERHRGKHAAKLAAKAVAEAVAKAAAKPVTECLSSFYISPFAMDILFQPGLTLALPLYILATPFRITYPNCASYNISGTDNTCLTHPCNTYSIIPYTTMLSTMLCSQYIYIVGKIVENFRDFCDTFCIGFSNMILTIHFFALVSFSSY